MLFSILSHVYIDLYIVRVEYFPYPFLQYIVSHLSPSFIFIPFMFCLLSLPFFLHISLFSPSVSLLSLCLTYFLSSLLSTFPSLHSSSFIYFSRSLPLSRYIYIDVKLSILRMIISALLNKYRQSTTSRMFLNVQAAWSNTHQLVVSPEVLLKRL